MSLQYERGGVRPSTQDDDDEGIFTNKAVMMENFEEWIKMATDNKINSRNSWNFALIDYFYDLNVLRDSENNINFQKASATLDGCVKIYSSRVDSVTTETGRLLSGLAQEKARVLSNQGDIQKSLNDDIDPESGLQVDPATGLLITDDKNAATRTRNYNRVLKTTLVEFESIQLKELDQELNIDPLFKKALVDFDEGGAKSLLLNTLNIDSSARVIFDASIRESNANNNCNPQQIDTTKTTSNIEDTTISNSVTDVSELQLTSNSMINESMMEVPLSPDDEILSLGIEFIKLDQIEDAAISSSIPELRSVVNDISKAKGFIDNVNSKIDNFLTAEELNSANNLSADDYKEEYTQHESSFNNVNDHDEDNDFNFNSDDGDPYDEVEEEGNNTVFEQDLLAYFDETLKRNWRGREHWKVRNYKMKNLAGTKDVPNETSNDNNTTVKKSRTKTEIDFFTMDDTLEDIIFAPRGKAVIDMPQKNRTNDSHYLLPDDFHFTTDKISRLFIKPDQRMKVFSRKLIAKQDTDKPAIADENYWASFQEEVHNEKSNAGNEIQDDVEGGEDHIVPGHMDNPFEDDGGVDFNQAFEEEQGTLEEEKEKVSLPNRVTFSRVAKKVDVKTLKSNIWKAIKQIVEADAEELLFSNITKQLKSMYTIQSFQELSTSFCFICLLHLANEHGLEIHNTEQYDDLRVTYDKSLISIS